MFFNQETNSLEFGMRNAECGIRKKAKRIEHGAWRVDRGQSLEVGNRNAAFDELRRDKVGIGNGMLSILFFLTRYFEL
jgi:hypothetical protein